MKAVFKREFKAYFNTPIGFVILAVFAIFALSESATKVSSFLVRVTSYPLAFKRTSSLKAMSRVTSFS